MATSTINNSNQVLEWKYLGNCAVGNTISLPSIWHEIKCITKSTESKPAIEMNSIYPYASSGNTGVTNGYKANTNYYGYARCSITATTLKFEEWTHIGVTPANALVLVFYR